MKFDLLRKFLVTFCLALAIILVPLAAEAFGKKKPPLIIKEQGSFFVGGEVLNRGADDDVTIHQMYVQYQVPQLGRRVPIVFTHGCCLSSKTWESTPDGRMGWDEYFLRHRHPVYLTDQVNRARSGFNATEINKVLLGEVAPDPSVIPPINQVSHQRAWDIFRFGPEFNVPHENGQFPIEALDELYKQMIPDLRAFLPSPNPLWKSLSDLAVQLDGAVLVGHSQSGRDPFEAALTNSKGVRGLISIEPGGCSAGVFPSDRTFSDDEIDTLASTPILVVFGDNLETGLGGFWKTAYDDCLAFVDKINNAGGNAKMLFPPDVGIFGNSHMIMQDRNSDEIADLILKWISDNVHRNRNLAHR
jgi:pimeloyl-ACP methyl ester carboxylesterase